MVELCAYFNNYFFKIVYENFEHISLQSYGATLSICLPLEFITRFDSTNIHRNVCKSLKRQCPFWPFSFLFHKLNTWMKKFRKCKISSLTKITRNQWINCVSVKNATFKFFIISFYTPLRWFNRLLGVECSCCGTYYLRFLFNKNKANVHPTPTRRV